MKQDKEIEGDDKQKIVNRTQNEIPKSYYNPDLLSLGGCYSPKQLDEYYS